jgi:molybdate transport system ATP-binding protein
MPVGAAGTLRVPAAGLQPGQALRVQLLARDLILATGEPGALSVRNRLHGHVAAIRDDDEHNCLVDIDAAGTLLVARVTALAVRELGLAPGVPVWVLVKAVSLRGHLYS